MIAHESHSMQSLLYNIYVLVLKYIYRLSISLSFDSFFFLSFKLVIQHIFNLELVSQLFKSTLPPVPYTPYLEPPTCSLYRPHIPCYQPYLILLAGTYSLQVRCVSITPLVVAITLSVFSSISTKWIYGF